MAGKFWLARRFTALAATGFVMSLAIVSTAFTGTAAGSGFSPGAALARATQNESPAGPGTSSISGTVTNHSGSVALQGICAEVDNGGGSNSQSASTNSSGAYTISGLAAGMYVIRFDNNGDCGNTPNSGSWVTQWFNNETSFNSANPVTVASDAAVTGIDAHMVAGGKIEGTVTGNSTALQHICVVVDTGNFGPAPEAAATTSSGTYTLKNLAIGQSYVVRFDNNGDCPSMPNAGSWVTQWYNNETSFNSANPVSVSSVTAVTGINAAMVQGAVIAGTVVNANTGAALPGICVSSQLFNQNGGGGGFNGSNAQTSSSGTYILNNLTSGPYQVNFNDCQGQAGSYVQQWWESAANQSANTLVNATAPNTTGNIDAALVPGGVISGNVTMKSNSTPLGSICVSVDTGQANFGQSQLSTSTDGSGNYTLDGLAVGHSYVIRFDNNRDCPSQGNQGSWLTQWYMGKSSFATATKVSVPSTTPVTGINAAMVQGGSISGTVTSGSGGQSGICVSVDPGLPGGVVSQQTQTGGDGGYTLNNVAAGSHKIRFDSYSCSFGGSINPWVTQWYNNATTWSAASAVGVTAGANTPNINASLVGDAGTISGTVANAAGGQQLMGTCVTAVNSSVVNVAATRLSGGFFNNNANYTLFGLSATGGPYKVRFDSCAGAAGSWVTQWFNNASSSSTASGVSVTDSSNTPNINAAMVAIAETHAGPNTGSTAGGTVVTLSGSGFTGATSVKFGTLAGTSLTIVSDSILTVTTPAHAAGTVLITVVTPSGPCSSANAVTFSYA